VFVESERTSIEECVVVASSMNQFRLDFGTIPTAWFLFCVVLRSISSAHLKSKDTQHKSQHKNDKRINNDLQNTAQKTKDQVRRNGKQLMLH
jgi:hemerythrin superfamily protein